MPVSAKSLPLRADVFREQVRTVVMVIGPILLLAAIPLSVVVALGIILDPRSGDVQVEAEFFLSLLLPAFALPLLVWWGGPFRSRAYYLSLPVNRPFHDLSRTAGGLLCLLVVVSGVLLASWLIAALTGGQMGVYIVDRVELRVVPPWFWITPFVAAIIAYTYGTALMLGTRLPIVWGIVSIYAPTILMEVVENTGTPGNRPLGWLDSWAHGPFGFVPVLTGMSKGGGVPGVHPDFSTWLVAVLTWGTLAALALALALRRQRDV